MRFGCYCSGDIEQLKSKDNIWIHAVSVGEVLAVRKIIRALKDNFPFHQIVISTVTQTGYVTALHKDQIADIVIYAPFDFSWIVNKVIRIINPKIYILAETEFWPNMLMTLNQQKIPVVLVNGRISDRSFVNYKRWKFLFQQSLKSMRLCCMQSDCDQERLIEMGVDKSRVQVVGNVKFDDLPVDEGMVYDYLHIHVNELWWVAGSTHTGEEEIVFRTYQRLSTFYPKLHLILAPRHVSRVKEICQLIEQQGYQPVRYSECQKVKIDRGQIVVIDEIGHLKQIYRIACFVFVGKSLKKGGGQNIIEPAFFLKPILVGPLTDNFRDVVKLFQDAQAIAVVHDENELFQSARKLLDNANYREEMGKAAHQVVMNNVGASARSASLIASVLTESTPSSKKS